LEVLHNMNWWDVAGAAFVFVLFVGGGAWALTARMPPEATEEAYREDERRWQSLQRSGTRGEATILRLTRPANQLAMSGGEAYALAATDLLLSFRDLQGVVHEATLSTFIERELMSNFATGRSVPIVYAGDNPGFVAIDRDKALLEIRNTPTS
jgi:hypothetical protein